MTVPQETDIVEELIDAVQDHDLLPLAAAARVLIRAAAVRVVLDELDKGDAANGSRDYGRGVAHATRLIRNALEGTTS